MIAAALLAALASPALADAMRCGNRLVTEGMAQWRVLARCGEPALRERWFEGFAYHQPVERWTYDFGPGRLLRHLRFVRGQLVAIDTEPWPDGADGRCQPADIAPGLSAYALRLRCGPPLDRQVEEVLAPAVQPVYPPPHAPQRLLPVHRERWIYDFGRARLVREVVLENGRVREVRAGRRGEGA